MTLPDETFRTWSYAPWKVSAADENDNSSSGLVGDHANTPAVTHLDSLGRAYKIEELLETEGTPLVTRLGLDIQGNPRSVTDPRDNVIQIQTFDMLGRPLFTGAADEGYDPDSPSTDKGQTRTLPDVASQPFLSWRSGDLALKQTYDLGRRPLALYVTEDSVTRLVTLTIYGDSLADTPAASFAKGRALHVYDTAGRVTMAYDFKGRTVEQTRQVFEDITTEANWTGLEEESSLTDVETWLSGLTEPLDAEEFTITTAYDALDRVTEQTTPDGSVLTPGYDAGGKLRTVSALIDSVTTDFVTDITYNARGQRETIAYGNTTHTTTTYDPYRFWPTRILTERDDDVVLQDLNYTRDPVGNITEITDASQESVFFSNVQVTPTRSFTYDALYRLIEATGREKVSQTQANAWYSVYAGSPGSIPDATNPALRSYIQSYTYDEAGNLTEMAHVPSSGSGWRRGYVVATGNNQLVKSSKAGDDPDVTSTYSDLYAYNHRGAMVFMPHLDASNPNLTRDFRDQIRSAALLTSGHTATYAYDASGQRVRKVVVKESIQEERIYLGSYEVWRKRSSGTLAVERQTLHIMDGQRRIAMVETLTVDDSSPPEAPSTRIRYQLDDHLGTAALETDEAGAVISYEEYHPYGSTAWYADDGSLSGSPKRYKYTGMERDDETGLQYHSARYYAPWLGRWTGTDPSGNADGINRFEYCQGDPIGNSDTNGRMTWGKAIGIGVALTLGIALSVATGGLLAGLLGAPFVAALVGGVVGGAVGSFAGSVVEQKIDSGSVDLGVALHEGAIGGVAGGVGVGVGGLISKAAPSLISSLASTTSGQQLLTSANQLYGRALNAGLRRTGDLMYRALQRPSEEVGIGFARRLGGPLAKRAENWAMRHAAIDTVERRVAEETAEAGAGTFGRAEGSVAGERYSAETLNSSRAPVERASPGPKSIPAKSLPVTESTPKPFKVPKANGTPVPRGYDVESKLTTDIQSLNPQPGDWVVMGTTRLMCASCLGVTSGASVTTGIEIISLPKESLRPFLLPAAGGGGAVFGVSGEF